MTEMHARQIDGWYARITSVDSGYAFGFANARRPNNSFSRSCEIPNIWSADTGRCIGGAFPDLDGPVSADDMEEV